MNAELRTGEVIAATNDWSITDDDLAMTLSLDLHRKTTNHMNHTSFLPCCGS